MQGSGSTWPTYIILCPLKWCTKALKGYGRYVRGWSRWTPVFGTSVFCKMKPIQNILRMQKSTQPKRKQITESVFLFRSSEIPNSRSRFGTQRLCGRGRLDNLISWTWSKLMTIAGLFVTDLNLGYRFKRTVPLPLWQVIPQRFSLKRIEYTHIVMISVVTQIQIGRLDGNKEMFQIQNKVN